MDTIWKAGYLLQLMEEALVKPCAMKREVWQPIEAVSTSVIIGIQVCTIDDWRHVQVKEFSEKGFGLRPPVAGGQKYLMKQREVRSN